MKRISLLLTTALLYSGAAAQYDPFQRGAPTQTLPTLTVQSAPSLPAAFGQPRVSNDGATTRVVYDLPAALTYTLTPTFSGLRIDVSGASVVPSSGRLGNSVIDSNASGDQVTLTTPFPLSLTEGWRASEATIANGSRVLILEFGATLAGGAAPSVRGKLLTTPPVTTPPVPTPAAQAALNALPPVDAAVPPSDTVPVQTGATVAPTLPLLGVNTAVPTQLIGQVSGTPQNLPLTAPRIGKNPGLTRVVLDLPAGTTYRLVPSSTGLRVDLSGVSAAVMADKVGTPELRDWRLESDGNGVRATFATVKPLTVRGGWRAQLLPPAEGGNRSRLAIDFAPALADLTPMPAREKVIAAVPPLPVASSTALLALSATYAKPRVVIDPGHGGIDSGARGAVMEKKIVLAVGLRVRELLQAAGVDVVMTRDRDTQLSTVKATDLNMRAALANNVGAQLYVSIHANAMPAQGILRGYGIETWWNPNHPLSKKFAGILQRNTIQATAAYDFGLKNYQSLAVLRGSRMPAALIEIGYITHPVDVTNLQDANYLERVAVGIASGIREALVSGVMAQGGSVNSRAVGGGDR